MCYEGVSVEKGLTTSHLGKNTPKGPHIGCKAVHDTSEDDIGGTEPQRNRIVGILLDGNAFNTGKAGKIIAHLEAQGFTLKAARVVHMSKKQAEEFYGVALGTLAPRGEHGVLVVGLDSLQRMTSNPFYAYLRERIDEDL